MKNIYTIFVSIFFICSAYAMYDDTQDSNVISCRKSEEINNKDKEREKSERIRKYLENLKKNTKKTAGNTSDSSGTSSSIYKSASYGSDGIVTEFAY